MHATLPLLLNHHATFGLHGCQSVVIKRHIADIPRRQLKQILFNPIAKTGRQLGGVDLHTIDRILTRDPHKPEKTGTTGSPSWLTIFLAYHEPCQSCTSLIADFKQLADTGHARLDFLRIWLDHTEGLVICRRLAHHVERLHIDQFGGCSSEMFLRVGRVVVVSRQNPDAASFDNLEGRELGQLLVVGHDLQTACLGHIFQFRKQDALQLSCDRSCLKTRLHPPASEQQAEANHEIEQCGLRGR